MFAAKHFQNVVVRVFSVCSFFSQLLFFKLKLSINHTDENQWISKKSLSMIIIPPNVWLLFAFISVVLMLSSHQPQLSSIDVPSSLC